MVSCKDINHLPLTIELQKKLKKPEQSIPIIAKMIDKIPHKHDRLLTWMCRNETTEIFKERSLNFRSNMDISDKEHRLSDLEIKQGLHRF